MLHEEKLRRMAGWSAAGVAAVGASGLLGAIAGNSFPENLRPDPWSTKANAALALLLAAGSLWAQHRGRHLRIGRFAACAVLAIAGATLLEYTAGLDLGLDELVLRDRFALAGTAAGRMSPQTAAMLAVVSVVLLLIHQKQSRPSRLIAPWLTSLSFAAGVTSLFSWSFQAGGSEDLLRTLRLNPPVALGIILIGIGSLCARPDMRIVQLLFESTSAGVLARRLFFGVAVIPMVLGLAIAPLLHQQHADLAQSIFSLELALIVAGLTIAFFSLEAAVDLNQRREEAEQARVQLTARLQEQAAQLQETVGTRTRELREVNASLHAAAETNARLALVANHATNGVLITDAKGLIEWINPAYERSTGRRLTETKGQHFGQFLRSQGVEPAALSKLAQAERAGEPCTLEILDRTADGRPFWGVMNVQPVRDEAGAVINFIVVQTDITQQRLAQKSLESANQRLQLATHAAELGIWEWDALTDKITWDARLLSMYGLDAANYHGTYNDWKQRLHPDEGDRPLAAVRAILGGANEYEQIFKIVRASDGAVRTIQARSIAQRDAGGKLIRSIGTERDITGERRTTQELLEVNERFKLALRSSHFGVWETELATDRLTWDDRMLEIYGFDRATFGGTRNEWLMRLHPDDRAPTLEKTRRVMEGLESSYDSEFRIILPDGQLRHIRAHGRLHCDIDGRPLRLVGLNRDVTAERQTQENLRLAEERWQLALEGNNDGVWDWNVQTGEFYYDSRYAKMLGYEAGELPNLSQAQMNLVHPEDRPGYEAKNQATLRKGSAHFQHEHRMRAKTGEWKWILDRGKIVSHSADGRPLRMVGTHTDITARKQLEQRLHHAEALSAQVSELAQIGGWEIELATSQLTWSEGIFRIFEVDKKQSPSVANSLEFYPPESRAAIQAALNSAVAEGKSFDFEQPALTSKGRKIWVRILGRAERRDGRPYLISGAIQDITSRHASDESRRELEIQLFQAQKMETLGTLAGGIAHDFNNLLTGIIGYHELAADSIPKDDPAHVCLGEARAASLRARELVDQILTFSRQSAGEEHEPVDLTQVIKEATRFLRSTIASHIVIETDIPQNCGRVLANTTQIYQVILNLGSNSAHAMRDGGGSLKLTLQSVDVAADRAATLSGLTPGRYARLSVRDSGHGMDQATLRRIFDPFFTTKKTREGTGLGLAVVHGIVRAHSGAIDVESQEGVGTTFHVYLPIASSTEPVVESNEPTTPPGTGQRVYVVDDEEIVGRFVRLALKGVGYQVEAFHSAELCLEALRHERGQCDLLLTDQTMPGMQGTELAVAARAIIPGLPVVIMSGYFSKVPLQSLGELSNAQLLAKPFTTEELSAALHRALEVDVRV